jgi:hypothetical protein
VIVSVEVEDDVERVESGEPGAMGPLLEPRAMDSLLELNFRLKKDHLPRARRIARRTIMMSVDVESRACNPLGKKDMQKVWWHRCL